jgi:quercetin dioxygenase-like cupin family protein
VVISESRRNEKGELGNVSASEPENTPNTAISFDLSELISQIKSGEAWKKRERNAITLTRGPALQMTLIAMHSGTSKPWHRVECPISIQVIEGEIEFITDVETVSLKKGEVLILKEGIRHHIKATIESFVLLTMAPEIRRLAG